MEEILTWKILQQAWYSAKNLVQLYSDTAENISSTMTKVELAKYIHLQMWTLFVIDVENFLHLVMANSIENNLLACNSWTGRSVSYKFVNWFWLNLPYPNSKMFSTSNVENNSHLQMDIF